MAKKKDRFKNVPLKEQIKPIFQERFTQMLGEEEYNKFKECILLPQRKSFRINTIKEKNPKELIKKIKDKGIKIEPVPWCEDAYFTIFDENIRTDLGNLYEHFLGKIYVQEATSMCPPEVLEIPENIDENEDFKVLDMAKITRFKNNTTWN